MSAPARPPLGASTDELIGYHLAVSNLPMADLQVAIPVAIDAVYAARNAGGTMHDAGAEAAVAVLKAIGRA